MKNPEDRPGPESRGGAAPTLPTKAGAIADPTGP
jgi:hypothetical protein